jgi:uncharacterized protein YndB with AHSA1/START domain
MKEYGVVTSPGALRIERLLPGPIERVWSYLIESDKRRQWLAAGRMDLRIGGRVEHIFNNSKLTQHDDPAPPKYAREAGEVRMHGNVTAVEPPRLLSYTWGGDLPDPSEVRFELTPRGDQVLLVVTHRRLADHDELISISAGWHTHLDILADRLAGRTPAGFWKTHTRLEAEYQQRIQEALE